jgi:mannose-1-phosphate guanylyltransferase
VLEAAEFVEKPERPAAETMLRQGGFVWNSGMFLFSASAILAELEVYAPAVLAAVRGAMGPVRDGSAAINRQASRPCRPFPSTRR